MVQEYVGTVEFRDLGAGEFLLHCADGKDTTYRLVFAFTSHETFSFLQRAAGEDQMVTVRGSVPSEDVMVAGGTVHPVLLLQGVE